MAHFDRDRISGSGNNYERDERIKDRLALALKLLAEILKPIADLLLNGISVFFFLLRCRSRSLELFETSLSLCHLLKKLQVRLFCSLYNRADGILPKELI